MGGLGSGPSLKMGGFQTGHSLKNEGDFGTKNNKETYIFKRGSFGVAQVGKVETNVYVWKVGSFRAVLIENVESLGAAQAEKPKNGGLSDGTYPYCHNMGVAAPHPGFQ